jgi:hypothetical protein
MSYDDLVDGRVFSLVLTLMLCSYFELREMRTIILQAALRRGSPGWYARSACLLISGSVNHDGFISPAS